ncbi:MAG: hypothetical protein AB1714_13255 [Acidobacteriota bacterium]
MRVFVKLIGPYIYQGGFSEKDMDFDAPVSAETLVAGLNLNADQPKIVLRNGHGIKLQDMIGDGDRVVIAPIYSGG